MAEIDAVIVVPVLSAAKRVITSLTDLKSKKKVHSKIFPEIDKFIGSLNENVDLLEEHLPDQSGSWAFESLETDLNGVASYLEDCLKNGKIRKSGDADRIKEELERLRHDLINQLQVKIFIATLEVAIDAHGKMEDFETKMLELSSLSAAHSNQAMTEIRALLQPLVEGTRRQDQRIRSFVSVVRGNEFMVERSAETRIFVADVLESLQDLTEEGSSAKSTPPGDEGGCYLDPITRQLMRDPVKCTDGDTYDRFSVFRYNLNQNYPLVIACDDLKMRRRLFQKFSEQGVQRKFHSMRKSYRGSALALANRRQNAEALVMVNNVLQWAPNDTECLEISNLLKLEIAEQQRDMAANEAPQRMSPVAANQASPPSAPLIKYMLPSPKPPEIEITERRVEHESTDQPKDEATNSASPEVLSDRLHRYFSSMQTQASPHESHAPTVQSIYSKKNKITLTSQMNQDTSFENGRHGKLQHKENQAFNNMIMVLCFPCYLCYTSCLDICCAKNI